MELLTLKRPFVTACNVSIATLRFLEMNTIKLPLANVSASIVKHCEYCVAVHSFVARNLLKVRSRRINALEARQTNIRHSTIANPFISSWLKHDCALL